jgi:hypothetical protein
MGSPGTTFIDLAQDELYKTSAAIEWPGIANAGFHFD